MQGKKSLQSRLFYDVSLESLVPFENFYRRLNGTLHLDFLYSATAHYYGSEGQKSIDPVVFFKILPVGYLNNIQSDRHLMAYCSDSLGIRLFLGYDLGEELPWHSTISRTRQLYGEEVFLTLFRKALGLCIQAGMVRGKRQCVDSAFVKANASLDSLVEKEVLDDAAFYAKELNDNSGYKVSASRSKWVEQHHRWKKEAYKDMPANVNSSGVEENGNLIRPKFLSNHTHYSPTDPDAKISVKPGKTRQMNYAGQLAVDDAHHVVTGACASTAGSRDSAILHEICDQTIANLQENQMEIEQVAADAGYSSGESLQYCKDKHIDAWIPNFGQYKPEREGFIYNSEQNRYECVKEGGNKALLAYKGQKTDSKGYSKHIYRSSEKDCGKCPLRASCCGKVSKFKKIDDSIHKPLYDEMHRKITDNKAYAKFISKRRSSTVEPVLGTLINHHCMKRVNTRSMAQANKHVMMAALVYNLKKYMRCVVKKPSVLAQAVALNQAMNYIFPKTILYRFKIPVLPHPNFSVLN